MTRYINIAKFVCFCAVLHEATDFFFKLRPCYIEELVIVNITGTPFHRHIYYLTWRVNNEMKIRVKEKMNLIPRHIREFKKSKMLKKLKKRFSKHI